jgi:hypothetical protein
MSQVFEPQPNTEAYEQPRRNNNCLIYGCLGMFLGTILLIVCSGFAAYRFVNNQLDRFTATEPINLPVVEYEPEKLAELEARIEDFRRSLDVKPDAQGTAAPATPDKAAEAPPPVRPAIQELVLTADDINALLAKEEKFRSRVFIKIQDGKITGDISMPLDEFAPSMKGRYLNGSATFGVYLENGMLYVTLEDGEVKGERLPEAFLEAVRKENLAKELNNHPENSKVIRRFESVQVEGDKIIARLKIGEPEPKDSPEISDGATEQPSAEAKPAETAEVPVP